VAFTDPDLSALADDVSRRLGVVGAQVAVLRGDEIRAGAAGVERLDTGVAVADETLFQIGSTTKVHSAALLMQLVDEGRVDVDVPVAEQLPGFRLPDAEATRTLTPRHLMSMTSGIDNGPYTMGGHGDDALAGYVAGLADLPLLFLPGQGFGYSNASTCVTGRLVEHVTGLTWEQAIAERLAGPCGLVDTVSFPEDVLVRRHALGHRVVDSRQEQLSAWSVGRAMGPAGVLCSTAVDLVRFGALFLQDGRSLDGSQVLSSSAVKQMTSRVADVPPTLLAEWWGLGPYGKVWDGVEVMGHSGTNVSGSSYLLWAAERGVAIATTVNTPALGYPFAQAVFRELFAGEAGIQVPEKVKPPAHVEVDADRLVGRYVMSQTVFTVERSADGLQVTASSDAPGFPTQATAPLVPLTPTTFLTPDPAIDGGRGWALAFIGADSGPATHLVNGFFAMRRAD
jgi:CubicO group peptidase (beta-lactamase class C family)